jgi:hypothetical protein
MLYTLLNWLLRLRLHNRSFALRQSQDLLYSFHLGRLIVSVVVLSDVRQPSLLVPEASVSQSFLCFASVSILTLFLKGSSANAWVALVPITHPINNTFEGISMVFESYRNF